MRGETPASVTCNAKSDFRIEMTDNYEANFHRDTVWKGNDLIFKRRIVASVVPDSKYSQMYRVQLPDGRLTDMVNLTRAKDAPRPLALNALIEGRTEASSMHSLPEAAE